MTPKISLNIIPFSTTGLSFPDKTIFQMRQARGIDYVGNWPVDRSGVSVQHNVLEKYQSTEYVGNNDIHEMVADIFPHFRRERYRLW